MRNVSSLPESSPKRPRICVAIDEVIDEADLKNRAVAARMNPPTSEQNIGRWRAHVEPGRDAVADLERALELPLGYISKVAGYVEESAPDDVLDMIAKTTLLSDGYKRIILRVVEEGIAGTAEDRKEQESWRRKTASTIRRSRRS